MIKLKHLVENATETAYAPLTKEEKVKLRETIKSYNQYRKSLKAEGVYATAHKIMEAVNLAERYALKECNEWMEAKMVERDMKEIKKSASKLYEEAQKIKAIEKQLEMLYEEVGVRLERYFEIADPIQEAPKAYQTQTDRVPVSLEPNFPEGQQAAGQNGQVVAPPNQ